MLPRAANDCRESTIAQRGTEGEERAMAHRRGGSLLAVLVAGLLAACSSNSGASSSSSVSGSASTAPIVIGISLSQTGDFSDPGKAAMRGYQLWADTVNGSGGILGRQVQLKIARSEEHTSELQ